MKIGFPSALSSCFCSSSSTTTSARRGLVPDDETVGHSFRYVRSSNDPSAPPPSTHHRRSSSSSFKSLSGASVSANPTSSRAHPHIPDSASRGAFESSDAFSALPLRLTSDDHGFFLSGPIDCGAFSVPLDDHGLSSPRGVPRCRSDTSRRTWAAPLRSLRRRCRSQSRSAFISGGGSEQWVHGKAGEDRVHVVVSEEQQWLFIGIYDGFNGTDAADFLVCSLYCAVFNELKGLFWDSKEEEERKSEQVVESRCSDNTRLDSRASTYAWLGNWLPLFGYGSKEKAKVAGEFANRDESRGRMRTCRTEDHEMVLEALSRALEITEAAYLEMMDGVMDRRPEVALVGSCLLVVLMRDDVVYVMNLGDSRAIVAQYKPSLKGAVGDGENSNATEARDALESVDKQNFPSAQGEGALQLSVDHSTNNLEEVLRVKEQHQDDKHCIINARVKGRLKLTRAFGAAFLKEAKWNDRLLEMFRCRYIGAAPYVSSSPSLCYHRLGSDDQFLVISSDGLYQYLTNEEVVSHVRYFMENSPDGDPAHSLVEELLARAADKAGMDFKELLDVPQGDRRKFHDDITVIVISLEGRIWKSTGKCV